MSRKTAERLHWSAIPSGLASDNSLFARCQRRQQQHLLHLMGHLNCRRLQARENVLLIGVCEQSGGQV